MASQNKKPSGPDLAGQARAVSVLADNQYRADRKTRSIMPGIRTAVSSSISANATDSLPAALINFDLLPDSAHVRQPVVKALYGCSDATVWRHVKKGLIPSPRKISSGISAWNVGALRRALAEK